MSSRKSARYCFREAMNTRTPLSTPTCWSIVTTRSEIMFSRCGSGCSPDFERSLELINEQFEAVELVVPLA